MEVVSVPQHALVKAPGLNYRSITAEETMESLRQDVLGDEMRVSDLVIDQRERCAIDFLRNFAASSNVTREYTHHRRVELKDNVLRVADDQVERIVWHQRVKPIEHTIPEPTAAEPVALMDDAAWSAAFAQRRREPLLA